MNAGAWQQMLQTAWVNDGKPRFAWMLGLLLIGAAVAVVPVAVWAPPLLARSLLVAASLVLLILWWALVAGLLRQNQPHAAQLVPGQVRRLRQLFLSSWIAVVVMASALLAAAWGHGAPLTLTVAALTLFIAWTIAWPQYVWLAWVAWFVVLPMTPLRERVASFNSLLALPPLPLALLSGLVLVAAWLSARFLFGAGGKWHHRRYAAAQRTVKSQALRLDAAATAPQTPFGSAINRRANFGYHAWLARLTGRPSSATARLAMVFGPALHGSSVLGVTLISSAFVLAALVLLVPRAAGAGAVDDGALQGVGFAILMGWAGQVAGVRLVLYQSRREQALLMLAPGLPRGAALNGWLLRCLVAHYLLFCAVFVGVMLLVVWWIFGAGAPVVALSVIAGYAALAAPAGLPLLARDWSRMAAPTPWSWGLVMVGAAAIGLIVQLMLRALELSPLAIALAGLPLLAVSVWWCWRRCRQMPPMLPAARLTGRGG